MLRRMARVTRAYPPAGLLSLLAVLCAAPLAGQAGRAGPQARLQGVVVDQETYQPVESATVRLLGTSIEVTTGRWGDFAFPDAPLGTVSVHVSAPGHPSVEQEVEVRGGRVAFVQIVLPSVAAVLSELFVQGSPDDNLAEGARTAAELLALEVPRARVVTGDIAKKDYRIELRGTSTLSNDTEPLILIDGILVSREDAYDALLSIPADDVEDIEVLKGPAAAALYPYAANGVVLVRTKRGR